MKELEEGKLYRLEMNEGLLDENTQNKIKGLITQVLKKISVVSGIDDEKVFRENIRKHPFWIKYCAIVKREIENADSSYYTSQRTNNNMINRMINYNVAPDITRWKNDKEVKLTKIISKWFWDTFKHNLSEDELTNIGTAVNPAKVGSPVWFRLFNPRKEKMWSAGDYADSGSCFWGGRKRALEAIIENENYYALLFFKEDVSKIEKEIGTSNYHSRVRNECLALGRCWLYKTSSGGYVLFNGYFFTNVKLPEYSKMLSKMLDTQYENIELVNKGKQDGTFWINEKGYGFLLQDDANEIGRIDLNTNTNAVKCNHCGESFNSEDSSEIRQYNNSDGSIRWYCSKCMKQHIRKCCFCGNYGTAEEILPVKRLNKGNEPMCCKCKDREFVYINYLEGYERKRDCVTSKKYGILPGFDATHSDFMNDYIPISKSKKFSSMSGTYVVDIDEFDRLTKLSKKEAKANEHTKSEASVPTRRKKLSTKIPQLKSDGEEFILG